MGSTRRKFAINDAVTQLPVRFNRGEMVVMNNQGLFFLVVGMNDFYQYVIPLHNRVNPYSVVWKQGE